MTLIEWLIVEPGVLTGNSECFSDDEADCREKKMTGATMVTSIEFLPGVFR